MTYKNVILQDEFPFEYSSDEMNTPFVSEYSKMFEHLDLSGIRRYPYGIGPNGYDNHSMIKAFIVYALEGYRSIPQHSPIFKETYPLRQSAERVNAFLQLLGWENPKCYSMKAIENIIGFALLGKSLKTFL